MKKELIQNIREGVLDCNNQELFFKTLIRGFLLDINKHIKIRNNPVPHKILGTGDDIMFLEKKGYDYSKEPLENTNEDYIYDVIPRCIVNPEDISIDGSQITSPYSRGEFQLKYDDELYTLSAEFRRIPLTMNIDLKYYVDSFNDLMELVQQIISKLIFIKNFYITYMGQAIACSYKVPESLSPEKIMELDGSFSENKQKTLNLTIELISNIPIFNEKSVVSTDTLITNCDPPRKGNAYNINI